MHTWQHDDMAGDPEILDIIGDLRGTAMVDEEESFESESEDDDEAEDIPQI